MNDHRKAFFIAVAFLFAGILVEYTLILRINSGRFVYTLDDAYIHLALAENIIDGHYGVNSNEFSEPSSSILWPFLLAPFAKPDMGEYVPLLINIAAAIGTLVAFLLHSGMFHPGAKRSRSLELRYFCLFLICERCHSPPTVKELRLRFRGLA